MRTLSDALTTAQQAKSGNPTYKIVLTSGASTYTFAQDRILHLLHTEQQDNFIATVVLDNSANDLSALNVKGYKGVISHGFDSAYSAAASLWVVEQKENSTPGRLTVTLYLEGVPNLLGRDEADDDFLPAATDPTTIAELLAGLLEPDTQVFDDWQADHVYSSGSVVVPITPNGFYYYTQLGGTSAGSQPTWPTTIYDIVTDNTVTWRCEGYTVNAVYSHCAAYTPTALVVSTTVPGRAFRIYFRDSRLEKINDLLRYVTYVMLPQGDVVKFLIPTTTGTTYAYEYNLASGHTFFQKSYTLRLALPNRADVESMPGDATLYSGTYSGADNSLMDKRTFRRVHLASNQEGTDIATAIIGSAQLARSQGQVVVPMNVGQEIYDYIKVTDSRGNNVTGNVGYIQREAGPGIYRMVIGLGGIRVGGMPVPRFVVPGVLSSGEIIPSRGNDLRLTQFLNWFSDTFVEVLNQTLETTATKIDEIIAKINAILDQLNAQTTITSGLAFVIDGAGVAITTGQKGHLTVPFNCTIVGAEIEANQSGSIVVDIWKDTYANFPPTDADSITASTPLTISSTTKTQDTTLTNWLRSLSKGQILAFNVDSCTTIQRVTVTLTVERVT